MPEEPSSSRCATVVATNVVGCGVAEPVIDVRVDEPAWTAALPYIETMARETVFEALRHKSSCILAPAFEISLMFTGDQHMQELNSRFRGKDRTTNVLSFPGEESAITEKAADGSYMLGDVVLAFGCVQNEAIAAGKSLSHRVMHLLVHGVLHLLGHDHMEPDEATRMERREIEILSALGVSDPYQVDHQDKDIDADV